MFSGIGCQERGFSDSGLFDIEVLNTSDINKDSSYIAGETPISYKNNIENMGLAVFHGDKIVGELNGLESIFHLMVSNELESCNISIPNPLGDSESIDVNLRLKRKYKKYC